MYSIELGQKNRQRTHLYKTSLGATSVSAVYFFSNHLTVLSFCRNRAWLKWKCRPQHMPCPLSTALCSPPHQVGVRVWPSVWENLYGIHLQLLVFNEDDTEGHKTVQRQREGSVIQRRKLLEYCLFRKEISVAGLHILNGVMSWYDRVCFCFSSSPR